MEGWELTTNMGEKNTDVRETVSVAETKFQQRLNALPEITQLAEDLEDNTGFRTQLPAFLLRGASPLPHPHQKPG